LSSSQWLWQIHTLLDSLANNFDPPIHFLNNAYCFGNSMNRLSAYTTSIADGARPHMLMVLTVVTHLYLSYWW
jgi:hypothetical protein